MNKNTRIHLEAHFLLTGKTRGRLVTVVQVERNSVLQAVLRLNTDLVFTNSRPAIRAAFTLRPSMPPSHVWPTRDVEEALRTHMSPLEAAQVASDWQGYEACLRYQLAKQYYTAVERDRSPTLWRDANVWLRHQDAYLG